jgi:hypothetical protein
MALKTSETSCIFRQVPLQRTRRNMALRHISVANDNVIQKKASAEIEDLSARDIAPVLALLGVLGVTFYILMFAFSDILRSLPIFYP